MSINKQITNVEKIPTTAERKKENVELLIQSVTIGLASYFSFCSVMKRKFDVNDAVLSVGAAFSLVVVGRNMIDAWPTGRITHVLRCATTAMLVSHVVLSLKRHFYPHMNSRVTRMSPAGNTLSNGLWAPMLKVHAEGSSSSVTEEDPISYIQPADMNAGSKPYADALGEFEAKDRVRCMIRVHSLKEAFVSDKTEPDIADCLITGELVEPEKTKPMEIDITSVSDEVEAIAQHLAPLMDEEGTSDKAISLFVPNTLMNESIKNITPKLGKLIGDRMTDKYEMVTEAGVDIFSVYEDYSDDAGSYE